MKMEKISYYKYQIENQGEKANEWTDNNIF